MKILKYINRLMLLLLLVVGVTSCSDEDSEQLESGYGYVQFHVVSVGTRSSQELEYLSEAKKIEVTLLNNDNRITQTLNLTSVEGMGDMGLTSEKLQLLDGEYKLQSYTLYGISETVGNDLEPLIQIDLDELTPFEVVSSSITKVDVDVKSIVRGKVSFLLTKDLSAFDNIKGEANKSASRAIEADVEQNPNEFNYNNIESVEVFYKKKGSQQQPFSRLCKVYRDYETGLLRTDTLAMEAKEYEVTQLRMFASNEMVLLLAQDMKDCFVNVLANETTSSDVPVKYDADNLAIKDYIALFNIWKNMKGEEWSYYGENFPIGANWRFENRPVDEWGKQPCVTLNNAGRVTQLDLGAFNPYGDVPEDLCNLTELEVLYLGHHNEEGDPSVITDETNGFAIDMWKLNHNPNYNFKRDYMDVFRARMALLHPSTVRTDLYKPKKGQVDVKKYATPVTYGNNQGRQTNRITGLPKNIGNLKKLRAMFIANGLVSELPESFKELTSLQEFELYNCKNMKKVPQCLKELNLVVLNFGVNPQMFEGEGATGNNDLNSLFDNANNNICKTLQLLYLIGNKISVFPKNIMNIADLRMLDMTRNRLKELPALVDASGNRKFNPVQAFFADNQITYMDDNFCGTDDIESFSVTNNALTEFPNMYKEKIDGDEESKIYGATSLDFSFNKINSFRKGTDGQFNGVKTETLNLTSNRFKTNNVNCDPKNGNRCYFPDDLVKSGSIVLNLQLANCELDSIPAASFVGLKRLVALDLKGNRLRYIPMEFDLVNFPYFTGVDLSNNAFSIFPSNIFNVQAMSKVLLSGQFEIKKMNGKEVTVPCLKVFPPNLSKALGLRALDISGNDIRKIPETDFPTQLAEFNVQSNPNLEMVIPSEVCTFIQMGRMYLYYDATQMITGCPILETEN